MNPKPPPPVCKAFLICNQICDDQKLKDVVLVGLPQCLHSRHYPYATPLSFFARCTSGHGRYLMELLLQTQEGEVVWREGPVEAWSLDDPMKTYDLRLMSMCPVFPAPGAYEFVLTANGAEIARHKFDAGLITPPAGR